MLLESMDWVCDYCGGEGIVKYPTDRIEKSTLIICSHCSKPSAYAWCDNCGMGGQIMKIGFEGFPSEWECMECGSKYKLPKDFYEAQITFTPKHFLNVKKLELDKNIREQKHIPMWAKNVASFWEEKRVYLAYIMIGVSILFVILVILAKFFGTKALFVPYLILGGSAFFLFLFWAFVETLGRVAEKIFWTLHKIRKYGK
jgi:hypothetical protein